MLDKKHFSYNHIIQNNADNRKKEQFENPINCSFY